MVATYADPTVTYGDATVLYNGGAATDRFWIRDTSGSAGNWNDTANWSNISGGPSGSSVPGSSNDVTFDGNGISGVTIDAAVDVASITATSAYTGGGSNDGRFDNATNDQAVTVSGDVTLDNEQVDLGDVTWTVSGSFDAADVTTFNGNVSTLLMDGATKNITLASGNDLENFTISSSGTITALSDIVVAETFTGTTGTFEHNGNIMSVGGSWNTSNGFLSAC